MLNPQLIAPPISNSQSAPASFASRKPDAAPDPPTSEPAFEQALKRQTAPVEPSPESADESALSSQEPSGTNAESAPVSDGDNQKSAAEEPNETGNNEKANDRPREDASEAHSPDAGAAQAEQAQPDDRVVAEAIIEHVVVAQAHPEVTLPNTAQSSAKPDATGASRTSPASIAVPATTSIETPLDPAAATADQQSKNGGESAPTSVAKRSEGAVPIRSADQPAGEPAPAKVDSHTATETPGHVTTSTQQVDAPDTAVREQTAASTQPASVSQRSSDQPVAESGRSFDRPQSASEHVIETRQAAPVTHDTGSNAQDSGGQERPRDHQPNPQVGAAAPTAQVDRASTGQTYESQPVTPEAPPVEAQPAQAPAAPQTESAQRMTAEPIRAGSAPAPTLATSSSAELAAEDIEAPFQSSVSRAVSAVLRQQGGSLTVRLSPPMLGSLKIEMVIEQGVVDAKFETTTAKAHELLSNNLAQLKSSIESRGLSVDKLSVHSSPHVAHGSSPATSEQDANSEGQHRGGHDQQDAGDGRSRGGFDRPYQQDAGGADQDGNWRPEDAGDESAEPSFLKQVRLSLDAVA